jgi:hypothetical protein
MDIQAKLEAKEGNADKFLKPVSEEDLKVARQATLNLIPRVQV